MNEISIIKKYFTCFDCYRTIKLERRKQHYSKKHNKKPPFEFQIIKFRKSYVVCEKCDTLVLKSNYYRHQNIKCFNTI